MMKPTAGKRWTYVALGYKSINFLFCPHGTYVRSEVKFYFILVSLSFSWQFCRKGTSLNGLKLELTVSGTDWRQSERVTLTYIMLKQHELYPYWHVLQNYGFIVTNDEITRKESGKILVHLSINFNKIQLDNITFDTCIPTDHRKVLGSFGNNTASRLPSTMNHDCKEIRLWENAWLFFGPC
jgi:hypothetical protein